MGLTQDMSGNNCFINNSIAISGNDCETLLLQTNHQNISLIQRQTSHEWTPIESVNIDMNPLIINANELNANETQQQILLVSSPMDLITAGTISKPSTVQMVLSELPLITTATQLNVIQVPTNLLLTDSLIVLPQEGITLEVPSIDTNESENTLENGVNYENKNWFNDSELMAQQMNGFNTNSSVDQMALVSVPLNDCIAINAINKSDNNSIYCYSNSESNNQNHFFQSDNQLIGIIDEHSNQTNNDYDLNAFLASSLSSTMQEEYDPNQAKQWHSDSVIAYRALMAFKKVMPKPSCPQTK